MSLSTADCSVASVSTTAKGALRVPAPDERFIQVCFTKPIGLPQTHGIKVYNIIQVKVQTQYALTLPTDIPLYSEDYF